MVAPMFPRRDAGFSMIEVLVTILIVTFGLLGLAGLQVKMQAAEVESYQRAQALVLLADVVDRIRLANPNTAATFANYLTASPLGTPDGSDTSGCSVKLGAARDLCEWSNALKGAAELSGATKLGAMQGDPGCIEQIQAPNPAAGICLPASYRVSVVWQGLNPTTVPAVACNQGAYGNDNLRRAVSAQVTIGLPSCS